MAKSKEQREAARRAQLPHVIATGNPFDGVKLIGPFNNYEAALTYADSNTFEWDWWVVHIEKP